VRHLLIGLAVGLCVGANVSLVSGQTLHYRTFAADTDRTLWLFSVAVPAADAADAPDGTTEGDGPHSTFVQWRSARGPERKHPGMVRRLP